MPDLATSRHCRRHRRRAATAVCVTCGGALCVSCAVSTRVGVKCPSCAGTTAPRTAWRRLAALTAAVATLGAIAIAVVVLVAHGRGTGSTDRRPAPSVTTAAPAGSTGAAPGVTPLTCTENHANC